MQLTMKVLGPFLFPVSMSHTSTIKVEAKCNFHAPTLHFFNARYFVLVRGLQKITTCVQNNGQLQPLNIVLL
jgi:hypothetical protein